jgi:hypothetical protein
MPGNAAAAVPFGCQRAGPAELGGVGPPGRVIRAALFVQGTHVGERRVFVEECAGGRDEQVDLGGRLAHGPSPWTPKVLTASASSR